jgi:hypothetical protein
MRKIGSTVAYFPVKKRGCQTNLPNREEMKSRYEANFGKLEKAYRDWKCRRLKAEKSKIDQILHDEPRS